MKVIQQLIPNLQSRAVIVPLVIAFFLIFTDGVYFSKVAYQQFESESAEQIERITRSVSYLIDAQVFLQLVTKATEAPHELAQSSEYQALTHTLRAIQKSQKITTDLRLYYPATSTLTTMVLLATSNEKPSFGNQFPMPSRAVQAFRTSKMVRTQVYSDGEGKWISAFGPIKMQGQSSVGLVEIHLPLEKQWKNIRHTILLRFFFSGMGVLFLTGLIILLAHRSQQNIAAPQEKEQSTATLPPHLPTDKERKLEEALAVFKHTFEYEQVNFQTLLGRSVQPILFISSEGRCQAYHSRTVNELFKSDPTDRPLWEILGSDEVKTVKALTHFFQSNLEADETQDLPLEWNDPSGKRWKLNYHAISKGAHRDRALIIFEGLEISQPKLSFGPSDEESIRRCETFRIEFTYRVHECLVASKRYLLDLEANGVSLLTIRSLRNALLFSLETTELFCWDGLSSVLQDLLGIVSQVEGTAAKGHSAFLPKLKVGLRGLIESWERLFSIYCLGDPHDPVYSRNRLYSEKSLWSFSYLLKKKNENLKQIFDHEILCVPAIELFNHLREIAAAAAKKRNVEVEFSLVSDGVRVRPEWIRPLVRVFTEAIYNAVDHGIESAEERATASKNRVGKIHLLIRNEVVQQKEENWIEIVLTDDGRGVDCERLRRWIGEQTLESEATSDQEALDWLFEKRFNEVNPNKIHYTEPGLARIKMAVDRLGGIVEIYSSKGNGFKLHMLLPFPQQKEGELPVALEQQPVQAA